MNNVTKKYSRNAIGVKNVTINIEGKIIVGLLGPNGSGKTTILKLIAGLSKPTEGEVYVDSYKMPFERDKVAARMSAVIEDPAPHSDRFTVRELLNFVRKIRGPGENELREVVSLLGIEPILDKKLGELSKGSYKKVFLACALMGSPEIILLDEPFEGLDPSAILRLSEYLRKVKSRSMVIIATHSLHIASVLFDRIIFLRNGSVYREYEREQLLERIRRKRIVVVTRGVIDIDSYRRIGVIEVKRIDDRTYEFLYNAEKEFEILRALASDNNVVSVKEKEEDLVHLYAELYR